MKTWIEPELDGTGEGYGKFTGISVADLARQFEAIAAEGNMRAVSATLRITREQIEARGHLGSNRLITAIAAGFLVISALALAFGPAMIHRAALAGVIGLSIALVALIVGLVTTRGATHRAGAQERAIRALAIETLLRIVGTDGFKPKPLDSDQRRIVRSLIGRRSDVAELTRLLGD